MSYTNIFICPSIPLCDQVLLSTNHNLLFKYKQTDVVEELTPATFDMWFAPEKRCVKKLVALCNTLLEKQEKAKQDGHLKEFKLYNLALAAVDEQITIIQTFITTATRTLLQTDSSGPTSSVAPIRLFQELGLKALRLENQADQALMYGNEYD